DVDAEHAGQQGGGQVGGEVEQRGGAGLAGADAELTQPFGEAEGADGACGLSSGEQPGRGGLVADGGVALPAGEGVADEVGERIGQQYRLLAQADTYL